MSAYYEIVDGVRLPAKLGGHPALDFCNTLAGWNDDEPGGEYLVSYDELALWAGFAGVLEAERVERLRAAGARRRRESQAMLERARAFRAALYTLLRDHERATQPPAAVADELHAAAAAMRLSRSADAFEWQLAPDCGLPAPLLAVAWSAAELLTSDDIRTIRACPGTGCGWLFLDRRGRRRWCSMAACGNREKVRRFSARQQAATSAN